MIIQYGKSILYKLYQILLKLSIVLFYPFPIKKNRVVLLRDWGLGYGCNLKYLAKYIIENNVGFELIWLVNYFDNEMPAEIKQIKISRIKAIYALATAKVLISSIPVTIPVKKKKKQYFIFIPHGQAGAKPFLNEIELSNEYRLLAKTYCAMQNLYVASSGVQARDFLDYCWCNCEILNSGFPRNDMFFLDSSLIIKQVKNNLNIAKEYKIVLYAPTFRDNNSTECYSLDMKRIIRALESKTRQKWMVLVRLHPNLRYWYDKPIVKYSDTIKDVTDYPDIQELFLISELVITDYSATMFDFSLTKKKVILFATDIEDYIKMRGLKKMFFTVPFPLCKNNDEVESAIINFDEEEYQKNLALFYESYIPFDDGYASKRIVNKILYEING